MRGRISTIAGGLRLRCAHRSRTNSFVSLPLGIARDIAYEAAGFRLKRGEQLTFVSDGVIEAANTRGELFGFERTQQISRKSAGDIATAAHSWGQNDDITVVTVKLTDQSLINRPEQA